VIARKVLFTVKAEGEIAAEFLTRELVYESILNAPSILKELRSRNPQTKAVEEVWKARDTRLDRIVAIETVKEQHSERFKREPLDRSWLFISRRFMLSTAEY
jgi:hypothetical protein